MHKSPWRKNKKRINYELWWIFLRNENFRCHTHTHGLYHQPSFISVDTNVEAIWINQFVVRRMAVVGRYRSSSHHIKYIMNSSSIRSHRWQCWLLLTFTIYVRSFPKNSFHPLSGAHAQHKHTHTMNGAWYAYWHIGTPCSFQTPPLRIFPQTNARTAPHTKPKQTCRLHSNLCIVNCFKHPSKLTGRFY